MTSNSKAKARLVFLLPLIYLVIGFSCLVLFGSFGQDWGPFPFYQASWPTVLLIQRTGLIASRTMTAMIVTIAAGLFQYGVAGYLLDKLRASRRR